jgi:hypothetical protein
MLGYIREHMLPKGAPPLPLVTMQGYQKEHRGYIREHRLPKGAHMLPIVTMSGYQRDHQSDIQPKNATFNKNIQRSTKIFNVQQKHSTKK